MFTSRTCVRSRARAAEKHLHAGWRAREKLLYIWHYVSDSIPTKLFWGLTFSSAGGLSEEKYQSQFGNIFPVALFCPPYLSSPPLKLLFCISWPPSLGLWILVSKEPGERQLPKQDEPMEAVPCSPGGMGMSRTGDQKLWNSAYHINQSHFVASPPMWVIL